MAEPQTSTFRFKAIDLATNQPRSGEMSGESAYAVRANLRRIGIEVEELVEMRATSTHLRGASLLRRLLDSRARQRHRSAKAELCDAISTMLQAGITLEQGLGAISASKNKRVAERRMALNLRECIRDGESFSAACRRHPDWFDRLDIALMEAGEHASELPATLSDLYVQHRRTSEIADKLFVALAYPGFLLLAGIGALEFMSLNTLPRLIDMLTQARQPTPWLTGMLVSVGQGLAHWWPLAIAMAICGWLVIRWLVGLLPANGAVSDWLTNNPWSQMRNHMRISHLATALARLRKAGVGMGQAVAIAAETTDDPSLRKLLAEATEILKRGGDLSEAFEKNQLLDAEFVQFLRLGERSGELTPILEKIAERSRRAAERTNERLAAISGPLAIIILAALIGILVIACALPIAQLGNTV